MRAGRLDVHMLDTRITVDSTAQQSRAPDMCWRAQLMRDVEWMRGSMLREIVLGCGDNSAVDGCAGYGECTRRRGLSRYW